MQDTETIFFKRVNKSKTQNSVFYKGLRLYNKLPNYVMEIDSIPRFKNKVREIILNM